MKAEELRIGNWVYGSDNFVCNILSYEYLNDEKCDNYKPIPITPDILEKAGFERRKRMVYGNSKSFLDFHYYDVKNGLSIIYGRSDNKLRLIKPCKVYINYLHQLQNLYFALTGEELEIEF